VAFKIGFRSEIWNTAGEDPKNPHTGAALAVKPGEPIEGKAAITWNTFYYQFNVIFK